MGRWSRWSTTSGTWRREFLSRALAKQRNIYLKLLIAGGVMVKGHTINGSANWPMVHGHEDRIMKEPRTLC